mgnify:CR=1 FL=1|jgi:hypothetical protein|nr:hypothetical protein [Rhodoferax sp.]
MKHGVSLKAKVLELRRGHSLREVSSMSGLPLGTVKTICARSGAFKDNPRLRELFSLPAIQSSNSTALTVHTLPPQEVVTGDKEIDAVLWLRSVIRTGQADLIDKAMEASKRIKTPLKELSERYLKHLVSKNPGNWTVAFQTFGFDDLEGLAHGSAKKATRQHEAIARFGSIEGLFADTPAEQFARDALAGLKMKKDYGEYDYGQVDKRFQAHPDLMPNTLSDCLYELAYWHDLYVLRNAHDGCDQGRDAYARECFAFRCLARIKPKTKAEAVAVFRYLADAERMDDKETEGILLNLIG